MSSNFNRRDFIAAGLAGLGAAVVPASADAAPASAPGVLPVRPLGRTGLMPTVLGFGSGSRFLRIEDLGESERVLHRAVELGVRYFDTAYNYTVRGQERESIKRLGRFLIPAHRKQIILACKVEPRDAETAKRQIDACFSDLGTDHIDILHFHAVGGMDDIEGITAKGGALEAYRSLKEQGAIGAIGVTGHAGSKVILEAMKRIEPDCVMCPQNPGHSMPNRSGGEFTDDVIPYGLEHGIGLLAMKTTGQDALIGKTEAPVEQLIRYAMSLPVASAIVGISSMAVLESCAEIARTLTPMTADEMKQLRSRFMAAAPPAATLPYLTPGYRDGLPTA